MNIGIFSEAYFPQISGVTTSVDTLEKELKLLGHNVYIFTNYYPGYKDEKTNIFRVPSILFPLDKSCRIGTFYSFKIMKEIEKLNLDIVHTNTEFSMGLFGKIVAKKFNIPMIHTYHTMYEDWINGAIGNNPFGFLASKSIVKISKDHCNSCFKVVAPSKKVKDLLVKYNVKDNIEIIPNGIDLSPFNVVNNDYDSYKINEFKKSIGLAEDDFVLLNIGRQSKEKNVESIIYALRDLLIDGVKTKLVIIGDGPNRKNLENLANKLEVRGNILFLGKILRKDIEKYYKLADVFITASVFETQGLTVLEAMAANVSVIVKKDSAFDDVINKDVTGFVFEKDDELPVILKKLLNNKDLLYKTSFNAFSNVEKFSSKNFAKNIEKIYLEALK